MDTKPLDCLLAAFSSRLHAVSVCTIQTCWRLVFPPFDAVIIHFVLRGSGHVRLGNGEWTRFAPYSTIVVPPHRPHALGDPGEENPEAQGQDNCRAFGDGLVGFSAGDGSPDILMICGCVPRQEGHALGLADLLGRYPVESLADAGMHRHVFDLMLAEVERPTLGLQAMMEALMQQCLVLLVRRRLLQGDETVPIAALGHSRLGHAVLAILQNPAGPHSLESLAALSGMSRTTFAESFSRAFGQAPIEFVQRMRLRVAARLLTTTDLPVKVVAASAGYASRSHFSRSFAAEHGVDPSRFRERHGSRWEVPDRPN